MYFKKICNLLIILVITCIFTSCASISTFQTAQTLKPKESQYTVASGVFNSPSFNKFINNIPLFGGGANFNLPFIELGYRRGFIEKLDAGIKITVPIMI